MDTWHDMDMDAMQWTILDLDLTDSAVTRLLFLCFGLGQGTISPQFC